MNIQYNVIELRRYTIQPGRRATFGRYFETWFPEAFQQLGAIAYGHFYEREQPDRFTWLRGYRDMEHRLSVNRAFYYGPVWAEHKSAVNSLIANSDDVLLLRPIDPGHGLPLLRAVDPVSEPEGAGGIVVAQIFKVCDDRLDSFLQRAEIGFAGYRGPGLIELGVLATLDVPNNFPQHPVRTDGTYVVWFGALQDEDALACFRPALDIVADGLARTGLLDGPTETVILDPSVRSRLRWQRPVTQLARAA